MHRTPRIFLRKIEDVLHGRPAERVDGLAVVAHDHHVPLGLAHQPDDRRLEPVRVLVLVHQHVLELLLVELPHVGEVGQEQAPVHQQVVVVHHVGLELLLQVAGQGLVDLGRQRLELRVQEAHHVGQRAVRVHRRREHRQKHLGLGKPPPRGGGEELRHHRAHQIPRLVAVHDAIVRAVAQAVAEAPQDAVADAVERARPEALGPLRHQLRHPLGHLLGRAVGEREHHQAVGIDPLGHQVRRPVDQRAGLARARAGQHQHRTAPGLDHPTLLGVQLVEETRPAHTLRLGIEEILPHGRQSRAHTL